MFKQTRKEETLKKTRHTPRPRANSRLSLPQAVGAAEGVQAGLTSFLDCACGSQEVTRSSLPHARSAALKTYFDYATGGVSPMVANVLVVKLCWGFP